MDPQTLDYLRQGLVFYIILVCSITIHEWAHAITADKLDDPLPRSQGRVTLNPLAHMDFLGTVVFPLLMIFWPLFAGTGSRVALIGWGKPVMISLPNIKTWRRDDILITAAGPISNLVLCFILAITGGLIGKAVPSALELMHLGIVLNAALFTFNLIPIPPLDGSHFLKHAIGMREETYSNFSRWGFFILIILINIPTFRMVLFSVISRVSGFFDILMLSILQ